MPNRQICQKNISSQKSNSYQFDCTENSSLCPVSLNAEAPDPQQPSPSSQGICTGKGTSPSSGDFGVWLYKKMKGSRSNLILYAFLPARNSAGFEHLRCKVLMNGSIQSKKPKRIRMLMKIKNVSR